MFSSSYNSCVTATRYGKQTRIKFMNIYTLIYLWLNIVIFIFSILLMIIAFIVEISFQYVSHIVETIGCKYSIHSSINMLLYFELFDMQVRFVYVEVKCIYIYIVEAVFAVYPKNLSMDHLWLCLSLYLISYLYMIFYIINSINSNYYVLIVYKYIKHKIL